ncbi:MAG TPA: MXAN_5187 C-terminal domain-containing protein [Thermoanaerobaculia bacterium]|nr:MXAN_5187 C-terminal domain-containing protein [Thermoanaerobaculia bacterium]
MTNDEALDFFEEELRKLKTQYDLFFSGHRKLPPLQDRRRLDAMVHEIGKDRIRDNGARFRFNTLLGRYNQFRELWGRKMREREEGPLDFRRRSAAFAPSEERAAPAPPPPPRAATGTMVGGESYVKVTEATAGAAAQRLYEQIAEAQKQLGKGGLTLAQVEQIVRSQSDQMRSKFAVEAVGFRVEIADGKVKLKAKPLQKGS